jgi:hypothetical protein
VCGNCSIKRLSCKYSGEPGQTRQEALRTRVEILEELFHRLRGESHSEAGRLLEAIRSGDDLRSLVRGRGTESQTVSSSEEYSPANVLAGLESAQHTPEIAVSPVVGSFGSTLDDLSYQNAIFNQALQNLPLNMDSMSTNGSEKLKKGIESFFMRGGSMFHVFSRDEMSSHWESFFDSDNHSGRNSTIACLSAVAAVGYQWLVEVAEKQTGNAFYSISRHYLEDLLHFRPFDGIKVCTLMSMFNVLNRPTISLVYVGKFNRI